jgi:glutathione reductase (NADPH)
VPFPLAARYTLSGRDEKTLMKLLVHVETDLVVGAHM